MEAHLQHHTDDIDSWHLTCFSPAVNPGGRGKDQDKDGGEQDRGKDDGYVGLKVGQSVSTLCLLFIYLFSLLWFSTDHWSLCCDSSTS